MKKLSLKRILSLILTICLTVPIIGIMPSVTGYATGDNYVEEFETVAFPWSTFKETYPGWSMSDESQISTIANNPNDPRVATAGEFKFSSSKTADFDDVFITKTFDTAYTSDEVIFETKVKANSGNAPRKTALTVNGSEGTLAKLNLVSGNSATTGTFSYNTDDSTTQEIVSDTHWGTDYVVIKIVISKSVAGRENPYDTCYYYIGDLDIPVAGGINQMISKTQTSVNGFSLVWQDSTGSICEIFYDYFKMIGTKDIVVTPELPPLPPVNTEAKLSRVIFSYDFDKEADWSKNWELVPGDKNSITRYVEDGNGMMRFSAGSTTQLVARVQKKLKDIEEITGLTMPKIVLEYRARMNDVSGGKGVFCGENASETNPAKLAGPLMYAKENGTFAIRFGRDDKTEFASFTPNKWETFTVVYDNSSTNRITYLNGIKQGETATETGNGYYNTGGDADVYFRLNETDSGRIADLDYVTLYAYPDTLDFEVENENSADINSVNLIFNERLSAAGLDESMVSIDNGAEVKTVTEKNGKYVVEFTEPLEPLSTYNITVTGVTDMFEEHTITSATKNFKTRNPMLYADKFNLIDADTEQELEFLEIGNLKAVFSASNELDKDEKISVLVPVYDANHNMIDLNTKDALLEKGTVNYNDAVSFTLNNISQTENLSIFAWKDKTNPIPVSGTIKYTTTEAIECPADKRLPDYAGKPTLTTTVDGDKINVTVETGDKDAREVGLLVETDGETFYAAQKTSSDGIASFVFNAKYPKAKFSIKAGVYGGKTVATDEIEYFSETYVNDSFDKINGSSATTEDMKSFITELDDIFTLDTDVLSGLSDTAKEHVYAVLLLERNSLDGGTFADIDDFKKSLSVASVLGQILDEKNVADALENSSEYFKENAYEIYDSMTENNKGYVADAISGNAYFSMNDLSDTFSNQIAFQGIYRAEHYMQVRKIVTMMAEEIGLDLEKYNDIEDTRSIDIGLMGKLFDSYSDIADSFDDLVENAPEEETHKGSSGGGKGSSGGGSFYSPGAAVNTQVNTSVSQQTKTLFNDLDGYSWAEDAITSLNKKGIISGDGNGSFRPEAFVTRAEFTKMIVLAAGIYSPDNKGVFTDISEDDWYLSYAGSAQAAGLINGDERGKFSGESVITREDMAVILYRVLKYKNFKMPEIDYNNNFADSNLFSGYSIDAVLTMKEMGLINGVGENLFAPLESATRAQAAKMIYNFLSIESGEN